LLRATSTTKRSRAPTRELSDLEGGALLLSITQEIAVSEATQLSPKRVIGELYIQLTLER